MEYSTFAKYYDLFYKNKSYDKEVEFLSGILMGKVLDVGCGTGIHMSLLEQKGYEVNGVDLNDQMLDIARTRTQGLLFNQNMLTLNLDRKYDAIISMFAVMNHLKDTDELIQALSKFREHLNKKGLILIDLHNPQSSGKKEDTIDDLKRTMIWDYDDKRRIEKSKIIFEIDGIRHETEHVFKIFSMEELEFATFVSGLRIQSCYENYTFNPGTEKSKNLQLILKN